MEELTQEQTDEESKKIREEVTAEVFETSIAADQEPTPVVEEIEQKEEAVDIWEGVNPAVKESFDKLSSQFETRLKQTERRVGSIQNEASIVKKAADEVTQKASEAPTPEQVADAEKNKEEWEELKEDYPEWANAIEVKLSAQRTEFQESLPKIETKFNNDVAGLSTKIEELTATIEKNLISAQHPGWQDTINTQEYNTWITGQPAEMQALTTSNFAKDAIKVLDAFGGRQSQRTPAEIAAERKSRLSKAQSIPATGTNRQTKSEADQTDEEYRRSISNKIWDED